jgi:hypothetical protein
MRISIPLVVKALSRFLPAEERTRRKTAKLAGKRAHESCKSEPQSITGNKNVEKDNRSPGGRTLWEFLGTFKCAGAQAAKLELANDDDRGSRALTDSHWALKWKKCKHTQSVATVI